MRQVSFIHSFWSPFLTSHNFSQANISQLQLGIAVLQEQKTTQLDKIDAFKADLKHRQESEAAIITKYQDQLSRQESDSKRTIQLLERRADEAERNLAEANRSAEDFRAEISRKSLETKIPSTAHEEEISALEARLREQEESVKSLTLRANTVGERYKKGDLVSSTFRAPLVSSLTENARATLRPPLLIPLSTRLELFTSRKTFQRLTSCVWCVFFFFWTKSVLVFNFIT
jgi:hypothetical protein